MSFRNYDAGEPLVVRDEAQAAVIRRSIREDRVEMEYLYRIIDRRALVAALRDTAQELQSHRQDPGFAG